jgi:D-alanyl-D-alanine carboxypeptidase
MDAIAPENRVIGKMLGHTKGDYMRKILLATAALGAAAIPAAPAIATPAAPLYCIPPANGQTAAQGEVSAATTALAGHRPASLAKLHSVTATLDAIGPGQITLAISAKAHHKQVKVGVLSQSIPAVACGQQIEIKLTSAGRKLLKHSKKIKLNIVGTFAPSGGAKAVAKGSVTL